MQGASAEQLQDAVARARMSRSMMFGTVANTRTGRAARLLVADVATPQQFPQRAIVTHAIETANVGSDTARPHLPGRPPITSWDGEPGFGAPRVF